MYYIDPAHARASLTGREGLRSQVEAWWDERGWGRPPLPAIDNMAIFARHVATARYEDIVFSLMARRAGLVPCWPEYTKDKFVTCSPFKRSLVHRHVCSGRGRNGGFRVTAEKHADMRYHDGKPIDEIMTKDGRRLVDLHHEIQDQMLPGAVRFEISSWLKSMGGAADYYTAKLSMYVAHAVLFEDYHGGESGAELDGFTARVFEPAFRQVVEVFGVPPLIVPMPWWTELGYYPANPNWREHGVIRAEYLE